MAATIKSKITGKNFGPKQILGQPPSVMSMTLGVLMGIAEIVTRQTNDDGEVLQGLGGKFGFKSAFPDNFPDLASNIFWPPGGMMLDIIKAVEGVKDAEGKKYTVNPERVEFAFKVQVMRAGNPAGYEWGFEPLLAPTTADPLAALEAKIKDALPDLTAGSTAPALAAPDTGAAGTGEVIEQTVGDQDVANGGGSLLTAPVDQPKGKAKA